MAKANGNLTLSLEKNFELKKDLVQINAELEKTLKWTTSSQVLTSLTSQGSNRNRGLGYHSSSGCYNPFSKYLSIKDNLLFTLYGKNGHTRDSCPSRLASMRSLKKVTKYKRNSDGLLLWTKKNLIFPLSSY